jgi:acyl CoA:acetate/3-ketoacid CoA transferase beta subunit
VIEHNQNGLTLREIAEGTTVEEVVKLTEAELLIPDEPDIIRYS